MEEDEEELAHQHQVKKIIRRICIRRSNYITRKSKSTSSGSIRQSNYVARKRNFAMK